MVAFIIADESGQRQGIFAKNVMKQHGLEGPAEGKRREEKIKKKQNVRKIINKDNENVQRGGGRDWRKNIFWWWMRGQQACGPCCLTGR
jgi:hypothetical protein